MNAGQFGAGRGNRGPGIHESVQRRPAAVRPDQSPPLDQTSARHLGALKRSLATLDLTCSIFRRIPQRYFQIVRRVEIVDMEPLPQPRRYFI